MINLAKISWTLLNNDVVVINNELASATVDDITITYHDEFGTHIINKIDKTYERIGKDNIMKIDFKNSTVSFKFDQEKVDYDIKTKYIEKEKIITLKYNFGDGEKQIIIKRIDE